MTRLIQLASSLATFCILALACAHPSLYAAWGKQLTELSSRNGRADDVSMMLGVPPSRCEAVSARPIIGLSVSPERVVVAVIPGGPADKAGLRTGDSIIAIEGQAITSGAHGTSLIRSNARDGQPLQIETSRGILSVIPKLPTSAEQCYWEVQAGQIARTGGSAYVNQYGGAASPGGASYARFFRASCRIHDGFVFACQANWQE